MKKSLPILFILLLTILSGCGSNGDREAEVPELLEVELRLPEEKLDPGAEVELAAYVSQGGEAVEDASKVEFEIKKAGQEDSEMLTGSHAGDGVYTAVKQFAEEGAYSITAHITARDMHNMPTEELIIGNPEQEGESHGDGHHEVGDDSGHGHSHDHEEDIVVDLISGFEVKANDDTVVQVRIEAHGELLAGASVSFAVWAEGEEEGKPKEAAETEDGVYEMDAAFGQAGMYKINVIYEKGEESGTQLFTVMATE